MISMKRTLVAGVLATLGLGNLAPGNLGLSPPCFADPPSCNSPAAYRLFNTSTMGPGTAGCGRYEPIPCPNQGWFLNNPRGTGMDDPWRPPKIWPQTRYPVVPAYTRPSYGYYETSWRVMPLCNPAPAQAGPIFPAGYEMSPQPGMQPAGPLAPPQSGQAGQPLNLPSRGRVKIRRCRDRRSFHRLCSPIKVPQQRLRPEQTDSSCRGMPFQADRRRLCRMPRCSRKNRRRRRTNCSRRFPRRRRRPRRPVCEIRLRVPCRTNRRDVQRCWNWSPKSHPRFASSHSDGDRLGIGRRESAILVIINRAGGAGFRPRCF